MLVAWRSTTGAEREQEGPMRMGGLGRVTRIGLGAALGAGTLAVSVAGAVLALVAGQLIRVVGVRWGSSS
jgi:hypothetical protein